MLEKYPIVKDDTGNQMTLVLAEAKLPDCKYGMEMTASTYKFWTVIATQQYVWGNKAVSHESVAYWKHTTKRKLLKLNMHGFDIEELEDGTHNVFTTGFESTPETSGMRTRFKLTREKKKISN